MILICDIVLFCLPCVKFCYFCGAILLNPVVGLTLSGSFLPGQTRVGIQIRELLEIRDQGNNYKYKKYF